mgnify:CR=1 FL=1
MTIKISSIHELVIHINADNSCRVDFMENGRRLDSENWASVQDVIEEYC